MSTIDVREALWGLADTTQVRIIRKTVSGFLVSEEEDAKGGKWVEAVLQPLDPQQLLVKPEGQRQWHWWRMWCTERLDLDWIVMDVNGIKHRIMSRADWSHNGYYEYELVEGPPST